MDEELESLSHSNVPIDDNNFDGLRITVWKLLESKFREALTEFNHQGGEPHLDPRPKQRPPLFHEGEACLVPPTPAHGLSRLRRVE